jgi:hypothetical protein
MSISENPKAAFVMVDLPDFMKWLDTASFPCPPFFRTVSLWLAAIPRPDKSVTSRCLEFCYKEPGTPFNSSVANFCTTHQTQNYGPILICRPILSGKEYRILLRQVLCGPWSMMRATSLRSSRSSRPSRRLHLSSPIVLRPRLPP